MLWLLKFFKSILIPINCCHASSSEFTFLYLYVHTWVSIRVYVCVCVCVYTNLNPVAFSYWQTPSIVPIQGNSTTPNPNSNQTDQDFLSQSYWTSEHPVGLSIISYVSHRDECWRYPCYRCVCSHDWLVKHQTVTKPTMIYHCQCDRKCQSRRWYHDDEDDEGNRIIVGVGDDKKETKRWRRLNFFFFYFLLLQ